MKKISLLLLLCVTASGCSDLISETAHAIMGVADPTERGLLVVAWAILAHAVVNLIKF